MSYNFFKKKESMIMCNILNDKNFSRIHIYIFSSQTKFYFISHLTLNIFFFLSDDVKVWSSGLGYLKIQIEPANLILAVCPPAVLYTVVAHIRLDKWSEFKPSKKKKTEWIGLRIKRAWLAVVFVLWARLWWALDKLCIF